MVIIGGKKYYTVEEAAALAEVNLRTLRRWIHAGRLSEFLFPFRAGPNTILYRLEAPDEGDVQNDKGEWVISPDPGEAQEGGGAYEGFSGS